MNGPRMSIVDVDLALTAIDEFIDHFDGPDQPTSRRTYGPNRTRPSPGTEVPVR